MPTQKKRLYVAEDEEVRASIAAHIAWIDAQIERLQTLADRLVAGSTQLLALRKQLETAPGVGPVTALTLIALMPELGQRSGKTIAALAGLAPFNNDSGAFRGQRHIRGGRRRVRQALYMAALVEGFGSRPVATRPRASGPAFESLQGRNPQVVEHCRWRERYGDLSTAQAVSPSMFGMCLICPSRSGAAERLIRA